jgi:hypothetical protein
MCPPSCRCSTAQQNYIKALLLLTTHAQATLLLLLAGERLLKQ